MANIQVNIDIDDVEFKNLCIENINDLPKDKMEELLLKAVEVALIRDKDNPIGDSDSSILVSKTITNGIYSSYKYEPTKLMKEIIQDINKEQYLEPIAKEVANYITENYVDLVREYIIRAFTDMLFSQAKKWEINDMIARSINR